MLYSQMLHQSNIFAVVLATQILLFLTVVPINYKNVIKDVLHATYVIMLCKR